MFDVNHGFAFTVCVSARIQQPRLLGGAGERLALSGCFQSVLNMIKAPSSPPGDQRVVHKLHSRDTRGK